MPRLSQHPKEKTFNFRIDPVLKAEFQAATEAADRPAAQVLRDFMRDFVARQREADAHDAWFRADVEQAMREADDPAVIRLPHEKIASRWQLQRAALQRRIAQPPA